MAGHPEGEGPSSPWRAESGPSTVFQGRLCDVPVVGLLQSLELNATSGCVRIRSADRGGSIWLTKGRPTHATFGGAVGAEAVYRMLALDEGFFRVDFGLATGNGGSIDLPLAALLLEGARRRDHSDRLWKGLPDPTSIVVRLTTDGELDASDYALVLRCDGRRSLREVVDGSPDALQTLEGLSRLWHEGALQVRRAAARNAEVAEPRATSTDVPGTDPAEPSTDKISFDAEASGRRAAKARPRWWRFSAAALLLAAAANVWVVSADPDPDSAVAPVTAQPPMRVVAPSAATCPASMARVDDESGEPGSFCIDIHEVTVEAYRRCVARGECERAHRESSWPQGAAREAGWAHAKRAYGELCNDAVAERNDHPINCVTWQQARDYCAWVGKRLPTQAQWAFAASGAEGRAFPWGSEAPTSNHGNFCGGECKTWKRAHRVADGPTTPDEALYDEADAYPGTAPVGSYPDAASPFGVLDLGGNVLEWTADAVAGPDGATWSAVRGGGFDTTSADGATVAASTPMPRDTHAHAIGFRCVASMH